MAMFARVSRFEGKPESTDAGAQNYRDTLLPAAKKIAGFKGAYLLVDRKTGRGFSMTLWESEAAMKAREDAATQLRGQAMQAPGVTPGAIERYEVAVVA